MASSTKKCRGCDTKFQIALILPRIIFSSTSPYYTLSWSYLAVGCDLIVATEARLWIQAGPQIQAGASNSIQGFLVLIMTAHRMQNIFYPDTEIHCLLITLQNSGIQSWKSLRSKIFNLFLICKTNYFMHIVSIVLRTDNICKHSGGTFIVSIASIWSGTKV